MNVITRQTNNDGLECVVMDMGSGKCLIIVGTPRPKYTVTVKKEKLITVLKQIKIGTYRTKIKKD